MRAHVIQNGKVVNTIEVESLDFMPNLVDAAQGGKICDLWDGVRFSEPPRYASIETGRANMMATVNAECDKRMSALVAGYPENEQKTFAKQEDEARAYMTNPANATPMIDALAATRGIDKGVLVSRIIAKADLFAQYSGAVIGYRQKLEDQINAAQTVEALSAIDITSGWPV